MKIESFFPGRLRVRSHLFTCQEHLDKLGELADSIEGIKDISGNPETGSVTVLYDPALISEPMLLEAKNKLEHMFREFALPMDDGGIATS